jgi:hypothetical protein
MPERIDVDHTKPREGIDFDHLKPPVSVTDPQGLGAQQPHLKHLHKAGVSHDDGPLYIVVNSPAEEAAAIADGWLLEKPNPNLPVEPDARGPAPTRRR